MDRLRELLSRVTDLSDDELVELKDLILSEFDNAEGGGDSSSEGGSSEGGAEGGDSEGAEKKTTEASLQTMEELAEAAQAVQAEFARRSDEKSRGENASKSLADFKSAFTAGKDDAATENAATENAAEATEASTEDTSFTSGNDEKDKNTSGGGGTSVAPTGGSDENTGPAGGSTAEGHGGGGFEPGTKNPEQDDEKLRKGVVASGAESEEGSMDKVPEGREPQRQMARTTVVTAGADLPGWAAGSELSTSRELAEAFTKRISSMRGVRGGDGDKMIVASADLSAMTEDRTLRHNDSEGNLGKVQAITRPDAIVAAGGLVAPEESKYDLFGAGTDERPIRSALPVFKSDRGGVRFIRPPTLNDLNGAVGVWTVEDDIAAATDVNVRKPAFRVNHGPEIVVDVQAVTMILTFGNMVSRAYPELVARHNELALVAHARVAEQQLLTQIGALSTHVTGRNQQLSSTREVLMQVDMAAAAYRNRHRTGDTPLQCIMPMWFMDLLRADIAAQHPGDGLEIFDIAAAKIEGWFRARNINITWAMDGEAGQDYPALATGALQGFPTDVIWYLYVEGTFAFMDGGTLDLGLVRDSTLNSANDYQMFVESFENVVKFGHEALRVKSKLRPTGQGAIDVAPYAA